MKEMTPSGRPPCYLGLDLGATNAKAALVDDDGRVVRYASLALGPGAVPLASEHLKSDSRRDVVATPVFIA